MLTRLNLKRGEGELVEPRPHIVSRRMHTPQASLVMAHEEGHEGMFEDERNFRKAFVGMFEMVKVLYEKINARLYEVSSKSPKGDGGKGDKPPKWNGENGDKPPPSPPSSSSSHPHLLLLLPFPNHLQIL